MVFAAVDGNFYTRTGKLDNSNKREVCKRIFECEARRPEYNRLADYRQSGYLSERFRVDR